ncbi:MAG: EamA family transporter [Gammaproteobacteria bacterium]|nr:EamA family transporter [Gammaproteobacteria bacterium]
MAKSIDIPRGAANRLKAPALLLLTGSLLAFSIVVARVASDHGAPMLWFLTLAMGGAGLLLITLAAVSGEARGHWPRLLMFSIGAGAFQALPNAIGYLAVAHVGAGYLALAFAFPLLLTYLLALGLGLERFDPRRALGVGVALGGGMLLVAAKFDGLTDDNAVGSETIGWVLAASAIPLVIAAGNLYRTQFWPRGARPRLLAALMLLLAAVLTAPFAAAIEGSDDLARLLGNDALVTLIAVNVAAFALQFVAYFALQKTAGPVYFSQIGSVAAAVGTPAAVLFLGESLPGNFALAAGLIVAGALLFQVKTGTKTSAPRGPEGPPRTIAPPVVRGDRCCAEA